ncbi:hypothetical protein [Brevundimonas subvibrioides]|uniref:Uncharacterized protein n=1 Tax=Brevundimonas subvibrioides (strain ATCC 15264 / DSM 4735 / LMG 14903 / NBRC 16000 / CB 81) TaxID=633149 RepID=D9QF61_BRESC|nr:hypothetical protein [Brevundimonas subvibrioides]ADL00546.1 hypothetical protein Bresu_1234 [Brevundimonas subvibrioides ATCC 15264]
MLKLTCILIAAGGLLLAYWGLDARFHLGHRLRKWRHRRFWRQRNAREQRHRKLAPRAPD